MWFVLLLTKMVVWYSVEIDLSKELALPPKPVLELQVEAARSGQSATDVRQMVFGA